METLRVSKRKTASTAGAEGAWTTGEATTFEFELTEATIALVTEAGEKSLRWVPRESLGSWLYMDGSVRIVSVDVAGGIPSEQGARDPDRIEQILSEPVGTPVSLSREEAAQLVKRLFGSDKSLPTGTKYVEKVRGDWTSRLAGR